MTDLPRIEGPQIHSGEKTDTQELISRFSDWVNTVRERRTTGAISQQQEDLIIARSMTALYRRSEWMEKKAYFDSLTGLPNRRAFVDDLARMTDEDGLLIVDLDHFKPINDKFGHKTGDSVLAQVALTAVTSLRQQREEGENDKVYRIGGDEFAVLVKKAGTITVLRTVAEKIGESVRGTPFSASADGLTHHIPLTLSIGGGFHQLGQTPVETFTRIDQQALYAAKQAGRDKAIII